MPRSKSKLLREKHNSFVKNERFKNAICCIAIKLMSKRILETGKIGEPVKLRKAYDILTGRVPAEKVGMKI